MIARLAFTATALTLALGAADIDWRLPPIAPPSDGPLRNEGVANRFIRADRSGFLWQAGTAQTLMRQPDGGLAPRINAYLIRTDPEGKEVFRKTWEGATATALEMDSGGNAVLATVGFVTKVTRAGAIHFRLGVVGEAEALAIGPTDAVYVGGRAWTNRLSADSDAFVAKLLPDGSGFQFVAPIGGTGPDRATGIAVDAAGGVYVTGETESGDFPTTSRAWQGVHRGAGSDIFIAKFDSGGKMLEYSTFVGGSGAEHWSSIAVDSSGRVAVAGRTASGDFPTTPGAFQTAYGGGGDAFVLRLDEQGHPIWSTYLGGTVTESAGTVRIGAEGKVWVAAAGALGAVLEQRPARPCEASASLVAFEGETGQVLDHFERWPAAAPFSFDFDSGGRVYIRAPQEMQSVFPWGVFGVFRVDLSKPAGLAPDCVLNTASLQAAWWDPVAPGEMISIIGSGLGPLVEPATAETGEGSTLPGELGGTRVRIGGRNLALLSVSEHRIDAVVPFAVAPVEFGELAEVTVERSGVTVRGNVNVARSNPKLFASGSSAGEATVVNEDGALNSADRPARRGSAVTLYASGLGAMEPRPDVFRLTPLVGPWPRPVARVEVYVGAPAAATGAAGLEILYAGAAPGMAAGVVQISGRLPELAGSGRIPVIAVVEGLLSQRGTYLFVE
ncbi:MAG: SBBP repeat-containing protein [Bryobacteraceae bacterium]